MRQRRPISSLAAVVLLFCSAAAATPLRATYPAPLVSRLMAATACREDDIVPGPGSLFGIRSGGLSGERRFLLYDASASGGSPLAKVPIGIVTRPYWTLRGDLVFYDAGFAWLDAMRIARRRFSPLADAEILPFLPVMELGGDLNPVLVEDGVAFAGSGPSRAVLRFSPAAGRITRTNIAVGVRSVFAWDGDKLYLRIHEEPGGEQSAEQYDARTAGWKSVASLPRDSRLVFLRDTRKGTELGVLVSGEAGAPDRIVLLRANGGSTLAAGQFSHIVVSPDRRSIYGTLDRGGIFHPVPDRSGQEADWPSRLSGRHGVINIGLLRHGIHTYALLKSESATEAPRIDVLAASGALGTTTRFSLCAGVSRGVGQVASDGNNILFRPGEPRRNALVVYIHGGPFEFIGEGGHWLTDAFNLAGYPVVAVNYTGSDGDPLHIDEQRNLVSIYGSEVSAAVAFAQQELGGTRRPLVFVADSFGSLVGLSAIASASMQPSQFIVLDGMMDSLDLNPSGYGLSGSAPWQAAYLARAVHDLAFRLKPEALFAAARTTKFVFVHGEKDDVAPLARVRQFAAGFNALRPATPARIVVVPGMYHEPDNEAEFLAILRALGDVVTD